VGDNTLKKLTFAQIKMKIFIGDNFTGAAISKAKHHERSFLIAAAISGRFSCHVYQYQQKHLLWFLIEHISKFTKSTRYNYLLTLVKIIRLNKRTACWETVLVKNFKISENKYLTQH
jgi:hypothetical protein